MRQSIFARLRQRRRLLLRELIVLACALALGLGYSYWNADAYLPTLDGNIYSMLALEDSLLAVLASGNRNSLVRIDHAGTLLNYMSTADGQAFQYLESDGETVYAILSYEKGGETLQRLVALSMDDAAMRAHTLTELTTLRGAPAGVVWKEIYLPTENEGTGEEGTKAEETGIHALTLSGLNEQGQGFLAHVDLETGQVGFETILPGESVLFLKYIADGHFVWISRDKEAGQYQNGVWQRDILAGLSDTPLHISTCGMRCFISDSISGDVFEIFPEGAPVQFRQGEDFIGGSGFQYRQLEVYTTYQTQSGGIRLVGLCASENNGVIAGEDWSVREIYTGTLRLRMLWQHGWLAVLVFWAVLAALVESVFSILHSPRLSVRLLLCQVLAAVVLLGGVTAVQYRSFRETIREEAYQKLRLIGGSLTAVLSAEEPSDHESVEAAVDRLERQVSMAIAGQEKEYDICVVWDAAPGPVIASDSTVPAGYLLEDIKSRDYVSSVFHALRQGRSALEHIQTDTSCDFLYVQPFSQGDRTGCVAVSQNENILLAGQAKFLQRLLPFLAACPLLFLALAWITRRLLRPLDEIQRALEEFYTRGSGGQMQLCGMPHTELYEVGRVFNQLSIQTRVQFNELKSINGAYARLVPDCLLRMLHKDSVTELSAGDHAPVNGALLILIPRGFSPDRISLDRMTGLAAERIAQSGGMLVDYDEGLYALTALLPDAERARSCARDCLEQLEQNRMPVMAAVLSETVELGVFGGDSLLYSLAVSKDMRRKQAALERALDFDALVVENTRAGRTGLRLLGWDNGMELYEDPACRPSDWQSRWRETAAFWEDALRLFRERDFPAAMRLFAKVLRRIPEDKAARWYLFRCDALRSSQARPSDTELLFDWGEGRP